MRGYRFYDLDQGRKLFIEIQGCRSQSFSRRYSVCINVKRSDRNQPGTDSPTQVLPCRLKPDVHRAAKLANLWM